MKNITIALLVLLASSAYGRQLTVAEAIARAAKTNKSISVTESQLVETATEEGHNIYYIINSGKSFSILSADDCAPAVLGKGDCAFDPQNVPSNVAWWLGQYKQQISEAIAQESTLKVINIKGKTIEPLLKTTWNQSKPFNNMCPEFEKGQRAVTGCVATAIAQIMNYHKWPEHGEGSHTYEFNAPIGNEEVKHIVAEADFGATTYKWDDMLDSYNDEYSEANADAVAALMYHVGVSVDMAYDPEGSGAMSSNVPYALLTYFGYDKAMEYCIRETMTDTQWKNKIYNELNAKRPVYYSGSTSSSGHAFVCDGYEAENGFFHFNWGWGGYCDGYFTIMGDNAINPEGSGIGGSITSEGYCQDQTIITGICPDKGGKIKAMVRNYEPYTIDQDYVERNTSINMSGIFMSLNIVPMEIDLGVRLVSPSDNDDKYDIFILKTEPFNTYSYYSNLTFTTDLVLRNGTYNVCPIFRESGTEDWQLMEKAPDTTVPTITIVGDVADCLLAKQATIPYGNVSTADDITLRFTLKANKNIVNKNICAWIFPTGGGNSLGTLSTTVSMNAGEEREFSITEDLSSVLSTGDQVYLKIYDNDLDKYISPNNYGTIEFTIVALEDLPASAIDNIIAQDPKTVDVYSINGIKVRTNAAPSEAHKGLPRGMYIVGKKKIMVK